MARIVRGARDRKPDIQFTFDEYATIADASAFVNSMRALLDEARGVVAELENRTKTSKKRSKTARK